MKATLYTTRDLSEFPSEFHLVPPCGHHGRVTLMDDYVLLHCDLVSLCEAIAFRAPLQQIRDFIIEAGGRPDSSGARVKCDEHRGAGLYLRIGGGVMNVHCLVCSAQVLDPITIMGINSDGE